MSLFADNLISRHFKKVWVCFGWLGFLFFFGRLCAGKKKPSGKISVLDLQYLNIGKKKTDFLIFLLVVGYSFVE